MIKKLVVCYIPSLDLRRINENHTPYIYNLFSQYPFVNINTIPIYDTLPTILTGVYPPKLNVDISLNTNYKSTFTDSIIDFSPDFLTKLIQGFIHLITNSYDLAAIPNRRRRKFSNKRIKYKSKKLENILKYDDIPSIFEIIGVNNTNYTYVNNFKLLNRIKNNLPVGNYKFDVLDIYSLDSLQHWNLDDNDKIINSYKIIDELIIYIHQKCKEKDVRLIIFSDHGQDIVKDTINIISKLKDLKLEEHEYVFFNEVNKVRFWFHTDRARHMIMDMLSKITEIEILSYRELNSYNLLYNTTEFGELFCITKPGFIFYPHDFHHPLANIVIGLTNSDQRKRIFNFKHKGYHHHLPGNDSEIGFLVFLDNSYKTHKNEHEIIDFAPTILSLLGYKQPPWMKGHAVFKTQNHNS